MKSGEDIANCAKLKQWDKFTYSHLDCQGFVEAVLKELGIRKKDGSVYNWTGSNSMYRNYYSWRGTIEECKLLYGSIPLGAFVYIHQDTGTPDKYKLDGLGNFRHVGIYIGNDSVRDSTYIKNGRDGVGTRTVKGFTHVSLFSGVDYNLPSEYNTDEVNAILDSIREKLDRLKKLVGGK